MLEKRDIEEIAALPSPDILESLEYRDIEAEALAQFVALEPAYGLLLQSDPGVKLLQVMCYREYLLRNRVNEAIRSSLLAYSYGTQLDHLGFYYDVDRLTGESDELYKARIILAIRGRSVAGSEYYYRAEVMKVDPDIKDVAVYQPAGCPDVVISILTHSNGGVATQALIDAVKAHVDSDNVRVVSDRLQFQAASTVSQDITVNVTTLPTAPLDAKTALEGLIRTRFEAELELGRDLTRTWVSSVIHSAGYAHSVEVITPTSDVTIEPQQAANVGTITVNIAGTAY